MSTSSGLFLRIEVLDTILSLPASLKVPREGHLLEYLNELRATLSSQFFSLEDWVLSAQRGRVLSSSCGLSVEDKKAYWLVVVSLLLSLQSLGFIREAVTPTCSSLLISFYKVDFRFFSLVLWVHSLKWSPLYQCITSLVQKGGNARAKRSRSLSDSSALSEGSNGTANARDIAEEKLYEDWRLELKAIFTNMLSMIFTIVNGKSPSDIVKYLGLFLQLRQPSSAWMKSATLTSDDNGSRKDIYLVPTKRFERALLNDFQKLQSTNSSKAFIKWFTDSVIYDVNPEDLQASLLFNPSASSILALHYYFNPQTVSAGNPSAPNVPGSPSNAYKEEPAVSTGFSRAHAQLSPRTANSSSEGGGSSGAGLHQSSASATQLIQTSFAPHHRITNRRREVIILPSVPVNPTNPPSKSSSNPNPSLLISECVDCTIFSEGPVSFAKILHCKNCRIVLPVVEFLTSIQACKRVNVHLTGRAALIFNSYDSSMFLYLLSHPMVFGDTREVLFGPYNVLYSKQDLLMKNAGFHFDDDTMDTWLYPIVPIKSPSSRSAAVNSSVFDHRGTCLLGPEKRELSTLGLISQTGYDLLEFPNDNDKEEFLLPLPSAYAILVKNRQKKRQEAAIHLQEVLAKLEEPEKQKRLLAIVQAKYIEHLQSTRSMVEIADRLRSLAKNNI